MYIGIVQQLGVVDVAHKQDGGVRLEVRVDENFCDDLLIGASVSVNGTCLTVVRTTTDVVVFEVSGPTLARTTLRSLSAGDSVHLERSAKIGSEIGGHLISGHVSGVAVVVESDPRPMSRSITFQVPETWRKYIFNRGFLALHGASLTVETVDQIEGLYKVNFIPETLRQTNFGDVKKGDALNFEVDTASMVIVDTIERCLANTLQGIEPSGN